MKKAVVLGAGMVGSAMAADLCSIYDVTLADINNDRLLQLQKKYPITIKQADLSVEKIITNVVEDADIVIGAVPGFMGYKTLKAVINAGKNVADISFFDEDPFSLDELAKGKNVTAVVDCGVAPGLSNIILGYHYQNMQVTDYECLVGGLPFKRTLPFQYKAPFSPVDVIEEYTRPARIIKNSKLITKPALSEPENVNIDPIGTLVAFNTDGLRSLIKTLNIPNMIEKTLRYPGHIEHMQFLKDAGFFSKDEISVNGSKVKPVELTAKLLFPKWKYSENEKEFTVMQVKITGEKNGKITEHVYKLYDMFDEASKISSMARTTGYTCTAAARLIVDGSFTRTGICPPEYIGFNEECYTRVLALLNEKNIKLTHSVMQE